MARDLLLQVVPHESQFWLQRILSSMHHNPLGFSQAARAQPN